jgi:hypothetical protein
MSTALPAIQQAMSLVVSDVPLLFLRGFASFVVKLLTYPRILRGFAVKL